MKHLEELIYQKYSRNDIYKELKRYLKEYKNSLETSESMSAASFLYKHTKTIDDFITLIYKLTLRDAFENFLPLSSQVPLTVCALGSYGREELCIYSDIDIMICYKELKGYNIKPIIEEILYASWDIGLKLGHRVHTISELQGAANEDITIKSAMIESRFICGSRPLWFEIENELNKIRKKDRKEFINAKIEELNARRHKYTLSFEPNIKEGRGGLRDANTLFWILNSIYGIKSLKDAPTSLINEDDYKEFKQSFELLQKVRVILHKISGKKNDILSFDLILPVAKALMPQKGSDRKLEFEFFKKVLEAQFVCERFCSFTIAKSVRSLFVSCSFAEVKKARICEGVYIIKEKIFATFNAKQKSIKEILDILIKYQNATYDVSFLELARKAKLPKVCEKELFLKFKKILQGQRCYEAVMLLYKSSLLTFFIPPFKSILFLPQFDLYHKYPVDVHTIRTLYVLENIDDPFIKSIYEGFSQRDRVLLKLMLLFHDIGKGRQKDHSILGRSIWQKYALKFGIEDGEIVAKLILYHTSMSHVAQREDIYNENRVLHFASNLKDKRSLDFLTVLTYCDTGSVGNGTLNKHSLALLSALYKNTVALFENKMLLSEAAQRIKKEQILKKNPAFTELDEGLQKKIFNIETNMIFQKEKSDEIIKIAKDAHSIKDFSFSIETSPLLKIEIYRKIPLNLGYLLGKLSYLNIASMDIYKLYEGVKYFRIDFYEGVEDDDLPILGELIKDSFDMDKKAVVKKPTITKRDISVNLSHSPSLAEIKIDVPDQKGLLAHIASVFDRLGIEIVSAKVDTLKGRAKDMFLIEKNANFWNNKEKVITSILE